MSSLQIMHNLHYFFTQVLKDAHTREDFDSESINKALQWAVYCEKVYESCRGKRLEKQVDDGLKKLFSLDKVGDCASIDVTSVKNALVLLRKALLQNPHLSDNAFDAVMKSYRDECDLIRDCAALAKSQVENKLYNHFFEGLKATSF